MTNRLKLTPIEVKALKFACKYHKNRYDNMDYSVHLIMVNEIARRYNLPLLVRVAAFLHDVLEDTECTYEELKDIFGLFVANLVLSVTNEKGKNRKEIFAKTYPKIAKGKNPSVSLKFCDRLANIQYSILTDNQKKLNMYEKEHEGFVNTLLPATDVDIEDIDIKFNNMRGDELYLYHDVIKIFFKRNKKLNEL